MEQQFFQLLNATRSRNGLAPLRWNGQLAASARGWSSQMAAAQVLSHNPNLAGVVQSAVPGWHRGGENVGVGGTVGALDTAFDDSPEHYANIVGGYDQVGVGAVVSGSKIWVTFDFAMS